MVCFTLFSAIRGLWCGKYRDMSYAYAAMLICGFVVDVIMLAVYMLKSVGYSTAPCGTL